MKLIEKLPYFYSGCPQSNNIQIGIGLERDLLEDKTTETVNQFYVSSSTYSLPEWEKMLGLSAKNLSTEARRENIKARIRSRGATTVTMLKNICESYSNGEVEIDVNHANSSFVIRFVGSKGVPASFDELDKTINEIKPCHLGHSYEFRYNTHHDLRVYTHSTLNKYKHESLKYEKDIKGVDVVE